MATKTAIAPPVPVQMIVLGFRSSDDIVLDIDDSVAISAPTFENGIYSVTIYDADGFDTVIGRKTWDTATGGQRRVGDGRSNIFLFQLSDLTPVPNVTHIKARVSVDTQAPGEPSGWIPHGYIESQTSIRMFLAPQNLNAELSSEGNAVEVSWTADAMTSSKDYQVDVVDKFGTGISGYEVAQLASPVVGRLGFKLFSGWFTMNEIDRSNRLIRVRRNFGSEGLAFWASIAMPTAPRITVRGLPGYGAATALSTNWSGSFMVAINPPIDVVPSDLVVYNANDPPLDFQVSLDETTVGKFFVKYRAKVDEQYQIRLSFRGNTYSPLEGQSWFVHIFG
jgi:hypothetical protein